MKGSKGTETLVIIAAFIAISFASISNCDNYYADHGSSWVNIYDNCTDDSSQQSPVNVDVSDNVWKEFVFLPAYAPVMPTFKGFED
mmetsp:Transcript_1119/g.1007  ORF Transcript_1119/g.1007 Transcript_1119/m.1007 type:complete len:86 (-) Transcript_1119:532-789(-)